MKLILTLIIALMQAMIVFIPAKDKVYFPLRFSRDGLFLFFFCLITIICTVFLVRISDSEEQTSRASLNDQLRVRDSINQNKIVEAGKGYISALAFYGLKYDSAERRIEKLVKDSARKNITYVQGSDPVFSICSEEGIRVSKNIGDTLLDFVISFCSLNSPINVNIDFYVVNASNGHFYFIDKIQDFFSKKSGMELDGSYVHPDITITNHLKSNYMFFYFKGTYMKRNESKQLMLDEVYSFDIREKKYGFPSDRLKDDVKAFLSKL